MTKRPRPPNWETLLAQAALVQVKVPGAVLVGGTAAALHAHHRYSLDHAHVIKDLARHYDQAIVALETIVGGVPSAATKDVSYWETFMGSMPA